MQDEAQSKADHGPWWLVGDAHKPPEKLSLALGNHRSDQLTSRWFDHWLKDATTG